MVFGQIVLPRRGGHLRIIALFFIIVAPAQTTQHRSFCQRSSRAKGTECQWLVSMLKITHNLLAQSIAIANQSLKLRFLRTFLIWFLFAIRRSSAPSVRSSWSTSKIWEHAALVVRRCPVGTCRTLAGGGSSSVEVWWWNHCPRWPTRCWC